MGFVTWTLVDVSLHGWSDKTRFVCKLAAVYLVLSAFSAVIMLTFPADRLFHAFNMWMPWISRVVPFSILYAGLAVMWLTGMLPVESTTVATTAPW